MAADTPAHKHELPAWFIMDSETEKENMEFDLSKKHCFYFNETTKIPHGSRNEKALSDYIVNFAREHGYQYRQDELFNVLVDKPASPGYENCAPVILQAHIDMVNEKNKDSDHDFERDPLELYVDEEGWLHAKGTTLGADDGSGAAYMLAILDDQTLKHPPLQCIFTVMEEIGLIGASNLKAEDFHGRKLINLDSGGEVETTVSSAGGARVQIVRSLQKEVNDLPAYAFEIRGLLGGHSGGLIHLERGNSNILAARILKEMRLNGIDLSLVRFSGGLKYNAIPREADVTFVSSFPFEEIEASLHKTEAAIKEELEFSDPGFRAKLTKADPEAYRITEKISADIIDYMYLMPNGLMHRSLKLDGLTSASLNAGVVITVDDQLIIEDLIRSAISSHTDTLISKLELLASVFGFEVKVGERYSGWNYSEKSELREVLRKVLAERGKELVERATHGGLETGVFKGLVPDMDIITYGPIAEGEHTPDEKLDLTSFDRSYEILTEVLANCR